MFGISWYIVIPALYSMTQLIFQLLFLQETSVMTELCFISVNLSILFISHPLCWKHMCGVALGRLFFLNSV